MSKMLQKYKGGHKIAKLVKMVQRQNSESLTIENGSGLKGRD